MRYHVLVATAKPPLVKHLLNANHSLVALKAVYAEHKKTFERDVFSLSSISMEKFKKMPAKKQQALLQSISEYPIPFFLYEEEDMQKLCLLIRPKDTIALHGEGGICTLGLDIPSRFTITPYQLAQLFNFYPFPKHMQFNLELISCNLGSSWKGVNFAKICAQAFKYDFGYSAVHVIAYAGFVLEKKSAGKYSIALDIDYKRGQHASLEEARVTYHAGHEIHSARKKARIEDYSFEYCKDYFKITQLEREKMIMALVRRELQKFFSHYSNPQDILMLRLFDYWLHQVSQQGVKFFHAKVKTKLSGYLDADDIHFIQNCVIKPLTLADFPQIFRSPAYQKFNQEIVKRSLNSQRMFSRLTNEVNQQEQIAKINRITNKL